VCGLGIRIRWLCRRLGFGFLLLQVNHCRFSCLLQCRDEPTWPSATLRPSLLMLIMSVALNFSCNVINVVKWAGFGLFEASAKMKKMIVGRMLVSA